LYFVKAIPNILKNVCDARFLIVGDGSQLAELRQETARLRINDKAIFTGRVANADIAGFYAASDLVVLPSLREATSVAGLEAMACGRAVVGTRTGGIPQIITNGENGLLVAKQDSDALAEAVSSLLIQESTRRRMGRIARQRALREFSWQAIAEKLQRLYADSICLGNS
jgi:glycosyltransferase involved in cell wall biosynthesis